MLEILCIQALSLRCGGEALWEGLKDYFHQLLRPVRVSVKAVPSTEVDCINCEVFPVFFISSILDTSLTMWLFISFGFCFFLTTCYPKPCLSVSAIMQS